MDFSAFNPLSSNSLNLAARNNDVDAVKSLLMKYNPNCVDNRGWTCLHEAAANDSFDSLLEILKHPQCRHLSETYEGHTALYLACQKKCSLKTIKVLLVSVEDIANYASTEMVTPLHVVSAQGRTEVVELLLEYGALIDVEDFDGDTPLHDAAFVMKHEVVSQLLHAGAQATIMNDAMYTPLHLACFKGCINTVQTLHPFVNDINVRTGNGETPLLLATQNGSLEVVQYLLDNGADPHITNIDEDLPLKIALIHGNSDVFKLLLDVSDIDKINKDIITLACKPHYFNMEVIVALLESELGPEFFNNTETFYITLEKIAGIRPSYTKNAPLNSFLHISEYIFNRSVDLFRKLFYLFLMRGVAVNALYIDECPPLVYIHYCEHINCFDEVFSILVQHGCNIDYFSESRFPDGIIASVTTGAMTAPMMLKYSLACTPEKLIKFILEADILGRINQNVQNRLLSMVDVCSEGITLESLPFFVPALKHLCRLKIRDVIRDSGKKTTDQFIKVLEIIPLPPLVISFLQYLD